jgi:hypothetical protein
MQDDANRPTRVGISNQGTTAGHVQPLHVNGGKVLFKHSEEKKPRAWILRQAVSRSSASRLLEKSEYVFKAK